MRGEPIPPEPSISQGKTVTIVGAGVAGLSAACALAEAGLRVTVLERRSYPGGRASSYLHPGTGEVIDNCQHVLFGCCTNLVGFYERIGVADKIRWDSRMTLIEPGGRRSILAPSVLPAPLHGLPAILKAHCFTTADKIALVRAFSSMLWMRNPDPTESLEHWLERNHQTAGAIERFWRLVIASALNADLDKIALPYAVKVIRELFTNSAYAGSMGMSTLPLSELYHGAEAYLTQRGSQIIYHANVTASEWDNDLSQWTVQTSVGDCLSDLLVLALPFEATAKLLPNLPPNEAASQLAVQLDALEHWPICSAHLWFDRQITELDHAVLLDRDIHWMYHKSNWQPQRDRTSSYVELVISASREFAALSREEALRQAVAQLTEFFPEVAKARLLKAAFIKEVRATFAVPPGIDAVRPRSVSPWPQCYLAGDWIATGWPSTMESAARSGHLATEAILRDIGKPIQAVFPDLQPTGLMKLLG
jgi:squalene-associated FAD-dependent desaturase